MFSRDQLAAAFREIGKAGRDVGVIGVCWLLSAQCVCLTWSRFSFIAYMRVDCFVFFFVNIKGKYTRNIINDAYIFKCTRVICMRAYCHLLQYTLYPPMYKTT